eukprot:3456105-Heterocapsa_arctica.AAC.1
MSIYIYILLLPLPPLPTLLLVSQRHTGGRVSVFDQQASAPSQRPGHFRQWDEAAAQRGPSDVPSKYKDYYWYYYYYYYYYY